MLTGLSRATGIGASVHFSQTLTDANGNTRKASAGTLGMLAPRQLRWETLTPYKQTIVTDWRADTDVRP